ncbi:PREDICTED: uncharacterized protein LOC106328471 [Brassica oleracea var. oleracea]|uniref:uncharacterized protein LOC106328471 n=1 Tax=Brassica oleracea var. oleracea TaxID=109376 RepID=UPI0006A6F03E|nr:PREDICTED: uncharacterized protein LOC106328471 [Brassica oleracea var. oleracea]
MELQARKQREAALESALADKEFIEGEYRKKAEEAKRREEALENDLANMWRDREESKQHGSERERQVSNAPRQPEVVVVAKIEETPKEEPLVARLKARTQEMKEKEMKSQANGDANSHICKYVNHVPSLALNAQFAGQRSLIAYLRFRLNQRQIKGCREVWVNKEASCCYIFLRKEQVGIY